jgi:hypothetical protein
MIEIRHLKSASSFILNASICKFYFKNNNLGVYLGVMINVGTKNIDFMDFVKEM